ncbi:hypothetical protein KHA80_22585 [Anaerobacillus sp. HL2]|nr:hypothetical protein KHA80_22585 [Anaerobacillus sp. HL2]
MNIIQACTVSGVRVRFSGKKASFFYEQGEIERLLDIAENLYLLTKSPENSLL